MVGKKRGRNQIIIKTSLFPVLWKFCLGRELNSHLNFFRIALWPLSNRGSNFLFCFTLLYFTLLPYSPPPACALLLRSQRQGGNTAGGGEKEKAGLWVGLRRRSPAFGSFGFNRGQRIQKGGLMNPSFGFNRGEGGLVLLLRRGGKKRTVKEF